MLRIENLNKTIKDTVILHDCNFSFPSKGLFSICGKSGCGKSSLLNIISGLDNEYQGNVFLNDVNIRKITEDKFLKEYVSIVFQDFNLIKTISVKENIALSLKCFRMTNSEMDKQIQMVASSLNIDGLLNQLTSNLSGGEMQRVAIARAIIKKPKILLCDEPTGNLDKDQSLIIMNILKNLSKECLVILVSHNNELVNEYSDGIFYMKDGKIDNNNLPVVVEEPNDFNSKFHKTKSFIFLNFLKSKMLLISTITLQIMYICLISCYLINLSITNAATNIYNGYISSNVYSVSKVLKITNNEVGLSIEKNTRPELETIQNLFYHDIIYDVKYDFYFNKAEVFDKGKQIEEIIFEPYFDNYEEIFYANFSTKSKDLSMKMILEENIDDASEIIVDKFVYSKNIDCISIIEKSVIQIPTIYYPYNYFSNIFRKTMMKEKSKVSGIDYSWRDRILNADDASVESSYGLLAFSYKDLTKLNNENEVYEFTNSSKIKADSLLSQMQIIKYYILIFSFFLLLISIFIIVFLVRYFLNKKKNEILVFITQGISKKVIISNVIFVFLVSCGLATICSPICAIYISNYISQMFYIEQTIMNISGYFSLLLCAIDITFIVVLGILLYATQIFNKINISRELRCQ